MPRWAYNGDKILYTSAPLAIAADATGATWEALGEASFRAIAFPGTNRSVTVTFSLAATLTYDCALPSFDRKSLSALDVAFRQSSTRLFKCLGDAFFDERRTRAWAKTRPIGREGMYEMWSGKRHSIVMTAKGPMLQIDRAATVMLAPINLLEFMGRVMKRNEAQLSLGDCAKMDRMIRHNTIKWKIKCKHAPREYKLRGITAEACRDSMFTVTEDDGTTHERSVADYFKKTYPKYPIKRPDLPCAMVGKAKDPNAIRIPLELCSFLACQPAPMTPDIQSEQIKETAAPPPQRFQEIEAIHRDLVNDHKKGDDIAASHFGVAMGDSLITASAQLLPSPMLAYKDRDGHVVDVRVDQQKGQWNLRGPSGDLAFVEPGKADGGYVVIKFEQCHDSAIGQFLNSFERFARDRGCQVGRKVGDIIDGTRVARTTGEEIERFMDSEVKRLRERVGLVICFIGDKTALNAKKLYPAIKRWSHTRAEIPTQCVQAAKALGKLITSPQYHAGVLLKVNLKLGGANLNLASGHGGLSLLRDAPTMVVGFDVNHPQPGSKKPSFAALVASMDVECSKYHTAIGAQKSRAEITNLVDKMRSCLRAYRNANGVAPQRILFYRDGVAHNQFEIVTEQEVGEIYEACKLEGGDDYVPKLTVVIVQQRTRARFATPSRQQVMAGTVVNSDIVGADGSDWYMVAQHGLKGTACPSHYHIIHDDSEFDPTALQRLTFELCHLYARATKIVSRPAPVYYAHRAAFLAQYYVDDYSEELLMEVGSTCSNGSTGSSNSTIPDIKLGPTVASTVYFA